MARGPSGECIIMRAGVQADWAIAWDTAGWQGRRVLFRHLAIGAVFAHGRGEPGGRRQTKTGVQPGGGGKTGQGNEKQ